MDEVPSFAELLKQHRAAANLTQEEVAELAGLSTRAVSDLERGIKKHPYPHTVRSLIQALGLDEVKAAAFRTIARDAGETAAAPRASREVAGGSVSLPIHPTPFIGRQQEVEELRALLGREEVRLLTLTGPPGVGKTRLGLRIAEEVTARFADGIVFISLASLADPGLVPAVIADVLGVREAGGQPILQSLAVQLRPKRIFLVLDNFEHLLPAGAVVAHLLSSCPQLEILVTSRAVLHLSAEHEYSVPPLGIPVSGHLPERSVLSRYDAVQLFVQRAEAIKPGFHLTEENASAIAEICYRLDGLPLAIELAAARIRLFPPAALLQRLSDRLALLVGGAKDLPVRQQTLRGTLDWSFSLLSVDEQELFAQLGIFVGGCTLEAMEAACTTDGGADLLNATASLVDQSLMQPQTANPEEPRFVMLETIREYARERLAARGEADNVRQRHAAYFLGLAEQAEQAMWGGPAQLLWLARLEAEHDNLRAVLAWAEEQGDPTIRLRLAAALGRFWFIRGHVTEGRGHLERALAANQEGDPLLRARALAGVGMLAREQAESAVAVARFEEGLALVRALGNERWTAFTLFELGATWQDRGNWQRAIELYEESLAVSQDRRDLSLVRGLPLVILGWLLLEHGDRERAVSLLEHGLALGDALGDRVATGTALIGLGWAAHYGGDGARGIALVEQALTLFRELGHHLGSLDALAGLAWVRLDQEDGEWTGSLFREALTIAHERGRRSHVVDCLRGLGVLAGNRGELTQAAELFGAAERLREAVGAPRYPSGPAYRRAIAAARGRMEPETWEAAWEVGWNRPLAETLASVLGSGSSATSTPSVSGTFLSPCEEKNLSLTASSTLSGEDGRDYLRQLERAKALLADQPSS